MEIDVPEEESSLKAVEIALLPVQFPFFKNTEFLDILQQIVESEKTTQQTVYFVLLLLIAQHPYLWDEIFIHLRDSTIPNEKGDVMEIINSLIMQLRTTALSRERLNCIQELEELYDL